MADAFIEYAGDLPEIPDRRPWERPDRFLVKDPAGGWQIDDSGRRSSNLFLVEGLREAVDRWRDTGYDGASDVTHRLFRYWFDEDHLVPGFGTLRYHFAQREAIETLAYLVEIRANQDVVPLLEEYAGPIHRELLGSTLKIVSPIGSVRRLRSVAEDGKLREQDLPVKDLRRYAFKMATGSGKTWVMAQAIVWSFFHRKLVPGSDLSTNFLIVAPNVIVYERLAKDFMANRIFQELPLVPPEWRAAFDLTPIMRRDATEFGPTGNLIVTNIQQIYEFRNEEWTPANAIEALLGKEPALDLSSHQRSMLKRLKNLRELCVFNDEAHHVHDEELAWTKTLTSIHDGLRSSSNGGLSLWLDFSATPKDQVGMYYPWTICDYPLAQAVEDRIVKAPIVVTMEGDSKIPKDDPERVTADHAVEEYGFWIEAAVQRWNAHAEAFSKVGVRPVLFVMAETTKHADAIGEYLRDAPDMPFENDEVLIIHTNRAGDIYGYDLDMARKAARDIDTAKSPVKAIVSVMMLKEGWDVRNVSVVLGLRPFTARAEILPEQVIGRGLRLMQGVTPDRTQTLEVLGTRNLLKVLQEQLELEGVGVRTTKTPPPLPVWIEPIEEKLDYDITIPLTRPVLFHDVKKLDELSVNDLGPIYDRGELEEPLRLRLHAWFGVPDVDLGALPFDVDDLPMAGDLIGAVVKRTIRRAALPASFAKLYPFVRDYVRDRCFGQPVDLRDEVIRSVIRDSILQEAIAAYLGREIGKLTAERREIEFERKNFKLSQTRPFQWRRNLPPLECTKTVFNYIATYNDYERRFAEFLEGARDVARFSALGTTEQGHAGTQFKIDYLKLSGAIGFYHPDWVVVQKTDVGEVNWIIETKGRVWEGTEQKDRAMKHWCDQMSIITKQHWRYARINQTDFERVEVETLADLVASGLATASLFTDLEA